MNYLGNAGSYLSQTLFGFALYIVLLRFWMQWVRADFRNPFGQFIITVTNPIVIPLRKVLPSMGSVDTATVVLAVVVAAIKVYLLFFINQISPPMIRFLAFTLAEVIQHSIYILFAAIIIQIVVSWVNPYSDHPIVSIARSLADPLMRPARKLIPPIGGLDLSPILVFIFLQLSLRLIVDPLKGF
ncbi:MAG: YggT family protein [Acidiferrobacterales bacterium]|nr:YggT family protein [Acidiferrobacterales bacterium]